MEASMTAKKGHPKGFWFVSTLQICERFSYYGMRSILMLWLTMEAVKGGLGLEIGTAALIYSNFTMFVYFAPLAGGYIADTYLGSRKTFFIGSVFIALGMSALFITNSTPMLYTSLILMIIGNGLWKPNITSIVGDFYDNKDPRKDGAYSIFYMFINIGAFLAPLVVGTIAESTFAVKNGTEVISYGYKYGFLVASMGMIVGTVLYILFANKILGDVGTESTKKVAKTSKVTVEKKPLTKNEKKRVMAICLLSFFVIIFWAGFEQAGSSLTLYTNKYIDRSVGSFMIPTSWFQSINPFLCVVLGPTFAWLFVKLSKRPKGDIPTTKKMGYGLIILGIGFALMVGAAMQRGNVVDEAIKANVLWLLGAYTLHTVGEMFLSPVGLSMVSKLAPKQIASVMMGVWLFSSGVSNFIAGMAAAVVETWGGLQVFALVTGITVSAGILLCALSPWFEGLMKMEDETTETKAA